MKPKPKLSHYEARLRCSAEERLKRRQPEKEPSRTVADMNRVMHELQVHQIELEIQNEELQRVQNEVEVAFEKYSDLYDFAPVGYLTLDREGTVREANLASAELLGIDRSRLVGRRFEPIISRPDRPFFATFLTKLFATGAKEACELTLLREGNSPAAMRVTAVAAASMLECRIVIEDITALKQAEADRLILNNLESAGILAGGIAHDFNNLLTVILLNLDRGLKEVPPGEEMASRLSEALGSHRLTQQLITCSRDEAPVRKPTQITRVIREAAQSADNVSTVKCEFSFADGLWPAMVDEGQIGQVLRNLMLNAVEAMPRGGTISVLARNVVISPMERPTLVAGDYVQVSVVDRGVGIVETMLPKVFDPDFSTKEQGTQKGMGLGLTICHSIMQKHCGAISVELEPGVGTTFHLYLPACRNPGTGRDYARSGESGEDRLNSRDGR